MVRVLWLLALVLGRLPASRSQDEDIPHNEVKNWALKFGVDLWEFGRQFTKMNEIQKKYHEQEAEVSRKDGLLLIRELAVEVKNFMDIKMNAVMRIMESAEQAALSQRWEGGGPPRYLNTRRLDDIALMADRHFDHQAVNTSLSAVLVPQALLDSDPQVVNALRWSEHLDPVFVNNYEVDPTLSWQFYGSTTGFLRRFPAMRWPTNEVPGPARDLHDFRWSSWFVGAATSPKDVVVLLDASGVMSSLARQLARATVSTILDTLTDNDFVNVLTFSDSVQELLPCHKDMLAQATETNRRELKAGLNMNMKSEGVANFTGAFVNAFEILHKYNRTWQGCQCNQAIMLVTAGPPSSFQDVLKQYNWPHMPVRVFTYLVGKDSSSANDMHWIACNNKGYYEHVKAVEEVTEKVLNYVKVMARPMVMYQNDHPIHWTPAYAGGKTNTLLASSIAEGQLMTSVSTPIFDRRNYSERAANLLGVVGTDIPIRQLSKLVPPYKLGVNGYSFIVNNNGHVLYHPDLRPLFVETLKPNYNNIDLGHVELVDSETVSIENNTLLMDLRHDMIEQKEGETELRVKVHYDDMRRVSTRRHKYFYHPIEDTPFSLGLALPDGYGMYEVLAEQEIKLSQVNVTEYFKGNNWRVHPDWVYCEYNYANEHYFSSPEEQVLHFLARTRRPGWKWMSLRPRAPHRSPEGHTGPKKMEKDSYYCDKTLLQSLVFDAMVTHDIQRSPTSSLKEDKQQGYSMFGVTLSFVATRSGLLRWEEHLPAQQSDPHFSEVNRLAMDETWYKRAVDQHSIEPESFVFSVPFDSGGGQPLVTATHAVFVEHKGHRAPAAVVGLQFQHSVLASHFINITSACTGGAGCKKTCASEELDCYVLDNNGFIILSEHTEHAGMFFGQADGTIMDSLVQDGIYKRVSVTDYQGACVDTRSNVNAGIKLLLPWQSAGWLLQWLLGRMVWLAAQAMFIDPPPTYADNVRDEPDADPQNAESQFYGDDYSQTDFEYDVGVNGGNNAGSGGSNGGAKDTLREFPLDEEVPANSPPPPRAIPPPPPPARPTTQNRTHARPCTKRMELFILQPGRLNNSGSFNPLKGKLTNCHATGCERPFSVQKIPHSNLILLVVDTLCPCGSKQLSIAAQELPASETCARALYRRRPNKCISYHPEEIEIKQCGGCTPLRSARSLTVTASLLLALLQAS